MEQKAFMTITELDQLKALSDPLRNQILTILVEKSFTGQQLSKHFEISRSKIHYHLNELEKFGFIQVVHTEVKNGFEQKFFRAVARGFIPCDSLLPYQTEVGDYYRQVALNILGRAKTRVISAPQESFQMYDDQFEKWPRLLMQLEAKVSEKKLIEWIAKYRKLVKEFYNMEEDEEGKWFYLTTLGFQMDLPHFEHKKEDE